MIPDGETYLFGDNKISLATPTRGKSRHTFGGKDRFRGSSRADCDGILVHLLHCFDLTDNDLPFDLPGMRWLPLYYCFDFRVNTIGYRFRDDESLEFFFDRDDPHTSEKEEWPDDNYPLEFPEVAIQVDALTYDPTNFDDVKVWTGVFGIGKLSPQDQERLRDDTLQWFEICNAPEPESEEELWDGAHMPFMQGRPGSQCMNPVCEYSQQERQGQLRTIAITGNTPVDGVHVFGPHGDGIMFIFQACEKCQTIRVENQCS